MRYTIFFLLLTASIFAGEIEDERTNQTFPSEVVVKYEDKDITLEATGVATRRKFFFNVYSVASYLQEGAELTGTNLYDEMVSPEYVKQLTLVWLMSVSHSQLKKGLKNNIKKIYTPQDIEMYIDQIRLYNSFFKTKIKKGDVQIVRSYPDGTIEVLMNNELIGTIKNKGYAKALWSVWFGKLAVVDKERLISLLQ